MRFKSDYHSEEELGKQYDLRLFKRLLPYVWKYIFYFAGAVFLIILITLLDISIPYITKIAIDNYIVPQKHAARPDISGEKDKKTRFLTVDTSENDILSIVKKYPALFEVQNGETKIAYESIDKILKEDLKKLRRKDMEGVTYIALSLLAIVILIFGLNFVQVILMEYTGQKIMHDLRLDLYNHIQSLSISYYNKNPVGRIVTRATNDIQNLHEMFTSIITFVFKDLFLLLGITIVLLSINVKLALVSLLAIPIVFYTAFKFGNIARQVFRTLRVKLAEINSRFSETIEGIKVIQLFNQEKKNYTSFKELNREYYDAGMAQVNVFAVFMPIIEIMGSITVAIILFYGGGKVLSQAITLGALVAFISYMRMFFRPIRDIAEKFNILQNSLSSAERIFQILDDQNQIPEPSKERAKTIPQKIEQIKFNNISFSYIPGEPVLNDISFEVNAGQNVAIVGPTGSGKTTLINLLIRFYDPAKGNIKLNGTDIRSFPLEELRSKIALVTQDPFLFSSTIRENIEMRTENLPDEKLRSILEASNCLPLVQKLPNGIDSALSEGGTSISSGERQLISIARAISKNPELIIFDEATSYIDSGTEQLIQNAMDKLMVGRTSIIIAHRLATARGANRIYALKKGKFIESGTHEELMYQKGFYYKLNQMKSFMDTSSS